MIKNTEIVWLRLNILNLNTNAIIYQYYHISIQSYQYTQTDNGTGITKYHSAYIFHKRGQYHVVVIFVGAIGGGSNVHKLYIVVNGLHISNINHISRMVD